MVKFVTDVSLVVSMCLWHCCLEIWLMSCSAQFSMHSSKHPWFFILHY